MAAVIDPAVIAAVKEKLLKGAKNGNMIKVVEALNEAKALDEGKDENKKLNLINSTNADGETALHLAVQYGHDNIVKLLLSTEGININARSNRWMYGLDGKKVYNNVTPLCIALQYDHPKHPEIAELLLNDKRIEVIDVYIKTSEEGKEIGKASALNIFEPIKNIIESKGEKDENDEKYLELESLIKQKTPAPNKTVGVGIGTGSGTAGGGRRKTRHRSKSHKKSQKKNKKSIKRRRSY